MKCFFIYISFFVILILSGCKEQVNKFEIVECETGIEMDYYDYDIVQIVDRELGTSRDTIVNKVKKDVQIFKPCADYLYKVVYIDKANKVLLESKVLLTTTGKRWEFEPNKQDEVVIQYEFSKKMENRISKHQKDLYGFLYPWQEKTTTGIIENEKEVWMHPVRGNQYFITEVAPFPQVKLPLSVGASWTNSLSIHDGWGSWSNSTGNIYYKVVTEEDVITQASDSEIRCYKIEAKARFPFGTSYATFWFSRAEGFIKINYKLYTGEKLTFELINKE